MLAMMVLVALAAAPAYELDYGALPPANTGRFREFTVILSFKGEPDVKIPCTYSSERGPKYIADSMMECLNDPRWNLKQNGERITIYGYDDVPIQKVTVEGNGPKPAVRRVLSLPPEKK
jgi:hypothetical protein